MPSKIFNFGLWYNKYENSELSKDEFIKYLHDFTINCTPTDLNVVLVNNMIIGFDFIKIFFDAGADPRYNNDELFTKACCYREIDTIEFLIEQGADVNAHDSIGLYNVVNNCTNSETFDLRIVNLLLENGSKITTKVIQLASALLLEPLLRIFLEEYDINPNIILKYLLKINRIRDFHFIHNDQEVAYVKCMKLINAYEPNYNLVCDEIISEKNNSDNDISSIDLGTGFYETRSDKYCRI